MEINKKVWKLINAPVAASLRFFVDVNLFFQTVIIVRDLIKLTVHPAPCPLGQFFFGAKLFNETP